MNRRTILAVTGTTLGTPLVGCLEETSDPENGNSNGDSDASSGDEEYETCHLVAIEYEWLPAEIQDEVDATLEAGQYETDRLRFSEAVDPDRSYLVVADTPYEPVVETDDGTDTLELHEDTVVRSPEPRLVTVRNTDDREHEVHVELSDDDTFVDETVTLEPDGERELEATDRFGTYELTAKARTGHEDVETLEYRVGDAYFDGFVEVSDAGMFVTQDVADLEPCPWDVRYD